LSAKRDLLRFHLKFLLRVKTTILVGNLVPEKNAAQEERILPVLPLKNVVALPLSILPVKVGRKISVKAVESALRGDKTVFVTSQKISETENPKVEDLFANGTRAKILQVRREPDGTMKLLVEGIARAKIVKDNGAKGFLEVASVDVVSISIQDLSERKAFTRRLFSGFKEYVTLSDRLSEDILGPVKAISNLEVLIDSVAVHVQLEHSEKQRLLETLEVRERAVQLCSFIQDEVEVLKADKDVRRRVQGQIEKHQRDYYLNEQIRAIHRELGREDSGQELETFKKKAKSLKLSPEAREKVVSECKRLEQMPSTSPEASVSRNYIDWLLSVPWHKQTRDKVSLAAAEKVLDASHAGMKKPKERIVEFLAAKKFAGEKLEHSPILNLSGPPGVGKTSLVGSIAKSLGRTLIRISLGGVRDEAEIRGHRRTYIGAMPGKIIQAMKKAGVANPLILLDEVDKMSSDLRGDPSSALLEVLDPEQNKNFVDHFLEVGYDLSKVMFITTSNVVENIPYPLLDRLEIISLSGYTQEEKLEIASKFLLPKLLGEHKLTEKQVKVSNEIINCVISEYTKEAGVRQLERVIAKLMRKSIQILIGEEPPKSVEVDQKLLEKWLGAPRFKTQKMACDEIVGVANGLAWTEVGGESLEVEITAFKGKGALTITGQLGEVMQESAQAVLSYIRSKEKELGIKSDFYANSDIHIHIPEGAIPKDGPSAGITIGTAITSVLTKIPIKRAVAMTGEVTLRGRVLPVGGLREKLLAAKRLGMTTVIVPKENMNDIKEFENELGGLEIIYVETMDEVLKHALVRSPFNHVKAASRVKKTKKISKKSIKIPPANSSENVGGMPAA
jgi:ATP-dependent Lon protease